ncbi:MAG: energy transducer TonB [Chloroflexota bacterium]|nr:energy transducer TonB [Lentimicrobium sp.]
MKRLIMFCMLLQPFLLISQNDKPITRNDTLVGITLDSTIMVSVTKPQFPGGNKSLSEYLNKKINYTPDAVIDKIEGTVYISFIVNEDGTIGNVRIIKGIYPSLDKVAVDAIRSMPLWEAGTIKGKPSKQELSLPIKFTLPRKLKK